MKLNIFILFFLLCIPTVHASFIEDFGASTTSMGLGGQGDLTNKHAALNYYMPAALAHNSTIQLEASSFGTRYQIKPINNIVIENSINTDSGDEKLGNVDNDFSDLITNTFHVSLPLQRIKATLNATINSPFPYLAQFDSGDPYAPEYALIKSRPRRPQGFFNLAYALNNSFSFSLGAHLGVKAESNIFTKAAVNNEGETTLYTYARGGGEVSPKLSPIISLFYQHSDLKAGVYFQGEMESNLRVDLTADEFSTGIIFDSIIESILFYDPQTLKTQLSYQLTDNSALLGSVNYYGWKKYQTPKINVNGLAIMRSTVNYEKLKLKNTVSVKLGGKYHFSEKLNFVAGIGYEQSPFDSDFSENGNTIHSDIMALALGSSVDIEVFNFNITTSLGLSYKQLVNKSVTKTAGQENGQPGRKIGAPGYEIGGKIYTVSLGLGLEI